MSKRNTSKVLSLVLLLAAVLCFSLTVWVLVGYARDNGSSLSVSESNSDTKESTAEILKQYCKQNKERADALKEKNLFYAPPKPPGEPKVCTALFGDEAYIQYQGNFKMYKVGDTIGEHGKVTGIEATYVKIEWKGKEKKLAPIAVVEDSGPKLARPKPSKSKKVVPAKKAKGDAEANIAKPSAEEDMLAWMGVELSPELRARLERLWALLPDEMKENMKQEWENMTDEEKEKALEQLENMPDEAIDQMEEQMKNRR